MIYKHKRIISIFIITLSLIHSNIILATDNKVYINIKDTESPYFGYNDNQEPQGYIFDLFQTVNNQQFNLIFTNDTSLHGNTRQILANITKKEVPADYYFIDIPHSLDYYVFTRKNTDIKSLGDLFNKKIIILKNDLSFKMLYKFKASHISEVKSYNYALKMLAKGTNDCAIVPYYIGADIIKEYELKNLNYIITPLLSFNYGIAIPLSETEIIRSFKSGLKQSIDNNKYKLIENRWFYNLPDINNKRTTPNIILITILVIITLVVVLLVILIKFLNREIVVLTNNSINNFEQSNNSSLTIDFNNTFITELISSAPLWIFVNDINGVVYKMSKTMLLDIFNDVEKPDNMKISDIFDDDFSNRLASIDRESVGQKSGLISEVVNFTIKGEAYCKLLIKHPIRIKGNNRNYFINIITTPIVDGSYNIISSGYLLDSVINTIPDLIYIKNTKGEYLGGNKAFFDFYNISESEIVGKTDFDILSRSDAEKFTTTDNIVFNTGDEWENTTWEKRTDNEAVKLENIKIPIRDKKNSIFGLVGISHDVTRRHKYEQDLENAKKRVEESDRVKSSFLANMSHEIRTPMNSIIGFSDLLADPDLTLNQRVEIIDMIQTNGHTLIDLIDDIIDFSRLESGRINLKLSDFNLNTVISNAYDYGNTKKLQLDKEHLNITYSIGSVEDILTINSDPFRLRQVLKNLLNNSIKYSSSETIYLGYLIKDKELLIYIKNNNNNIISDEVFKHFSSNNKDIEFTFSDIEESAGISLIIAKKIIEMLGGKLFIDEKEYGKANFYFTIPLKGGKTINKPSDNNNTIEIPDWKNKTVLVAEDEDINYMLLEEILSRTNIQIVRAANGKEAVDIMLNRKLSADIILMDIRMPELNGVDASRKILEAYPETIIIAQTAYVMPEDKDLYTSIGIKSIISKPIDPSILYYTCDKFLRD